MDEGTTLAIRGQVACRAVLEALDDRLEMRSVERIHANTLETYGFSGSIATDDQCQGGMELDRLSMTIVEGAYAVIRQFGCWCIVAEGLPKDRKLVDPCYSKSVEEGEA